MSVRSQGPAAFLAAAVLVASAVASLVAAHEAAAALRLPALSSRLVRRAPVSVPVSGSVADEDNEDVDLHKAREIAAHGDDHESAHDHGHGPSPLCLAHTPDDAELDRVHREVEGARQRRDHDSNTYAENSFDSVRVFPLVVHVLYSSSISGSRIAESTILEQVDVLNKAYSGGTFGDSPDAKIRFKVKDNIRYVDSYTYASACRTKSSAYRNKLSQRDPTVINVFVCPANGYLGWAYLPWQYQEGSPYQTITINGQTMPGGKMRNLNLGDTLVHEMGHYLGLLHTFSSQGVCGSGDDEVADTPYERSPSYSCSVKDTCSQSGKDPIYNFMDYSPDYCMNRFTQGQVERMQKMVSHYRSKLVAASQSYEDNDGSFVTPCEGKLAEDYCINGAHLGIKDGKCICKTCVDGFYGDRYAQRHAS